MKLSVLESVKFFFKKTGIKSSDKILVALSGGIDSMVLSHILLKLNYNISIAHINYNLRGTDSILDMNLVKEFAEINKLVFHLFEVDKESTLLKTNQSIQLIAREIRYKFFNEIVDEYNYKFIATAHNLNDSIETFIFNFARGTGIIGLLGVPSIRGKIIRPLVNISRGEIENYATKNQLFWREDLSNESIKYNRNKIRHKIIPVLKELNPSFENSSYNTFHNLNQTKKLLDTFLKSFRLEVFDKKSNYLILKLDAIKKFPKKAILYELLNEYGINQTQIDNLVESINNETNTLFFTKEFIIEKSRKNLFISKIEKKFKENIIINLKSREIKITDSISMKLENIEEPVSNYTLPYNQIHISKERFPLVLRKRKPGDYIKLESLKGKKQSLKKYFINKKFSKTEKDNFFLLAKDSEVLWIINQEKSYDIYPTKPILITLSGDNID